MYFWKTPQLVEGLRNSSVSEADFKSYYLATSILTTIAFYLVMLEPRENMPALAIEALGAVIITILGINAAFNANGGPVGSRFVEKAVSISFPLLIKVLVAGFVLGFVVGFSTALGVSKYQGEWANAVGTLAIQSVFVWRLVVHMKATNA